MVSRLEKNISLFTNNDSAYETAISLKKSGVKVNVIVDIRKNSNSLIVQEALELGLKVLWEFNCSRYSRI